jgi:hypothetical protein
MRQILTSVVSVTTACHEAFYERLFGQVRLVLPDYDDDLSLDGMSLHAADGLELLRRVEQEWGVVPVIADGEVGDPWEHVGYRLDGREVVLLDATEQVYPDATDEEADASATAVDLAAGLIPRPRSGQ